MIEHQPLLGKSWSKLQVEKRAQRLVNTATNPGECMSDEKGISLFALKEMSIFNIT